MQSSNYAYVNGRFVPEEQATVSIFDRGFLYGYGVFETMRVYDGKVFRIVEHIQRLFEGLRFLGIESPLSNDEVQAACSVLIERNSVRDGVARVYMTSGIGDLVPVSLAGRGATTVVVVQERKFDVRGLHVIVASRRLDKGLSRFKTANRLPYLLAAYEAEQARANEAILLNTENRVLEFFSSNLFVVKNAEIFTPPLEDGPLPGITRGAILLLSSELRIAAHEVSFGLDFLEGAEEIFATSSLMEIVPVLRVGAQKFYAGMITQLLQRAYRALVRDELGL
jgi:branched-chain amino acid aminotransferase